ncbi:MAG: DUF4129 domain-containing protein [Chloroflexi bacterium]|nr:DUF4129 domain-containing protein [Chloroflexota bacterium]
MNWLRDAVIPGCSGALEALWLSAWINFALASNAGSSSVRFGYGWVLLPLVVTAVAGRVLERSLVRQGIGIDLNPAERGTLRRRRGVLLALCALLFLVFVKGTALSDLPWLTAGWLPAVFAPWSSLQAANHGGLVLFTWLLGPALLIRGAWLALSDVSPDSAAGWFLAGCGAYLLLFVELANSPGVGAQTGLGWQLALFLFGGMGWLGLVRQQYLEEQMRRHAGAPAGLSWLIIFGAISACMLALATGAALAGGESAQWLIQAASEAGGLAWSVVVFLASKLGAVLLFLLALIPLRPVVDHLPEREGPGLTPPPEPSAPLLNLPQLELPFQVPAGLVLLAIVGLLVAIVLLGKRPAENITDGDEERTSLWSWRLFWNQLRQLRIKLPAPRARVVRHSGGHNPEVAAAPFSIRSLYRLALAGSAAAGVARAPQETPAEFAPRLARLTAPDFERDLTGAYVKSRYGEVDASAEEIAGLLERWQVLKPVASPGTQPTHSSKRLPSGSRT